jgi:hypothetical protein
MQNAENWVSLREFSRMRGVSLGAVQKAIESGRVTVVRRGMSGKLKSIEANQAMRQWNGNTDPDQAARAGAPICPPAPIISRSGELPLVPRTESAIASADVETLAASGDDALYLAARRRKMEFDAKQSELNYLQALGRLIATDELEKIMSRRYTVVREKLMNVDSRAAIIAAELGIPEKTAQIAAILRRENMQACNELSDDAGAEAARGAAERVAA